MLRNLTLFILILITLNSCTSGAIDRNVKEGKVLYNIEYIKESKDKIIQAVLPKQLNFIFNKEKAKVSFKGKLNLYDLCYLSDNENSKWSIIYRLRKNIYIYEQDISDTKLGYEDYKIEDIIYSDETKIIANYTCKTATIKSNYSEKPETKIYYTDKIKINFPVMMNLYGEIDGVLMEFEVPHAGMLLKITADEVEKKKIISEEFKIPDDGEKINKRMMKSLLSFKF